MDKLTAKIIAANGAPVDPWADVSLLLLPAQPPQPRIKKRIKAYRRPDQVGYDAARLAAEGPCFTSLCVRHGSTLFDTARGGCLACEAEISDHGFAPWVVAEIVGADHYDGDCPKHGASLINLRTDKCVACRGEPGRPAQDDNPRAVARRDGATSYIAPCPEHGETAHSVARGKCLQCFSAMGTPRLRVGRPPQADNPRAVARRSHQSTFLAPCPEHGETPHSVAHGKCLRCFTTAGVPRVRQS